jgi:protein-S-isoprenylcysteine O-methyltransferase Ste14
VPHDAQPYRHLIALLWLAWGAYWLIAALNSKATARRESAASRAGYVLPILIGGLLIGWRDLPWTWLTARLWPRSMAVYWVGMALIVAGLAWSVWARVHLGRNWSGTVTVKEGHELIRSGPYAYTRHPIYTGVLSALLGTALASGTVRAALGMVIITAAFVGKLRLEERFMRETFPGEYARYSAQVPALIPFTRPRQSVPR